jgi:hypothetical protein
MSSRARPIDDTVERLLHRLNIPIVVSTVQQQLALEAVVDEPATREHVPTDQGQDSGVGGSDGGCFNIPTSITGPFFPMGTRMRGIR